MISPINRSEEEKMKSFSSPYTHVVEKTFLPDPAEARRKVEWTLLQSAAMSTASLVLLMLCHFHPEFKVPITRNEKIETAARVLQAAEPGILIVSAATFFFSFLQVLFILKFQKTHSDDSSMALGFIQRTSLYRTIAQASWFLVLSIYILGLILQYTLEPSKPNAVRAVAVVTGTCALIFCVLSLLKTFCLWNSSLSTRLDQQQSGNFATLV